MKKIVLPLAFLAIISFVFSSCNKQNQEYLLGEWNLLTKPLEDVDYKWYFTESKVYVMATDADENAGFTGELDTCAFGAYVLKNGVLTMALPVGPCRFTTYAGDWNVQGLSKEFMTLRLETNNGTIWYEFQKEGVE